MQTRASYNNQATDNRVTSVAVAKDGSLTVTVQHYGVTAIYHGVTGREVSVGDILETRLPHRYSTRRYSRSLFTEADDE